MLAAIGPTVLEGAMPQSGKKVPEHREFGDILPTRGGWPAKIEGEPHAQAFFQTPDHPSFRGETRKGWLSGAVGVELGSEALRSGTKRIISQMGVALSRARTCVAQQAPDDLKAEAA